MRDLDKKKVKYALSEFYAEQKLDLDSPSQLINYYPLGWFKIPFINLPARRRLLHLHDINHLLMGYDTSLRGEAQLAALELASGFPSHCRIGYLYSPFALLPGLLLCPIKVYKAFIRGLNTRNACHLKLSKETLFNSKVSDLKDLLNILYNQNEEKNAS